MLGTRCWLEEVFGWVCVLGGETPEFLNNGFVIETVVGLFVV